MSQNASRTLGPLNAVVLSLALILPAIATGCGVPLFTATETSSEVFQTSDTPTIVVDTINGSIDISNGEPGEVVVEVNKHASGFDQRSAAESLENIEVEMKQEGDEIHITAHRHGHRFGECGASVIIAAPEFSKIRLKSRNGYIVAEGMQAGVMAKTTNAKIEIYEASGPIEADTRNSPIHIEAVDALVDARTANSRIRFQGTLSDGDHEFKTSNSRIDVTLPEDAEFRFEASTSNGSVRCDFPYEEDDERQRGRRKSGMVGDNPNCSLDVETSNGSIRIREKG